MTGYKSAFFILLRQQPMTKNGKDSERNDCLDFFLYFILRSKGEGAFDSHVLIMIERWKEQ